MVETHQPLGTVGAGQGRQEARGLAFVALSLVVGQQLKRLTLGLSYPLRGTEGKSFQYFSIQAQVFPICTASQCIDVLIKLLESRTSK